MRKPVLMACFGLLLVVLLSTASSINEFGEHDIGVGKYYNENAGDDTSSKNIVTSIVIDYRGYDTLGEITVLFTATIGVLSLFKREEKDG
ncbi:MAG: hydrogen gas-evolving membrane-bound hydrogenase subunit E [Candidatus Methanofastidiosia archaeon]